MQQKSSAGKNAERSGSLGLILVAFSGLAVLTLIGLSNYEDWAALFVGIVLFGISLPILIRQADREGDRKLLWLLALALLLKLVGATVRHYVAFEVYGGGGDVRRYHEAGILLSQRFLAGDFNTGLDSLVGTDFIRFFTGVVYTIVGPIRLAGYLLYSWLGFWGLFLFYRGFVLAVPEGRSRTYARLVFFLPSLLFWPSSIGKEAWMMFALGIAAFGAARILSGTAVRGIAITSLGLWLASFVRPHFAGILALALAAAYLLRRPREQLRQLAPIAKLISLATLTVIAGFVVVQANAFLQESGIETTGVTSVLGQTAERSGKGGSEFTPSVFESPAGAPLAIVSVLFRPFLTEAHNMQAVVAGLETTFLLLFTLLRLRWLRAALGSIRRQPYVAFAFVYSGLSILALSGIANFGLLARQRVQLLPLYVALLCVPPRKGRRGGQKELDERPVTERLVV